MDRNEISNSRAHRLTQAEVAIAALKDDYDVQLRLDIANLSEISASLNPAQPDPTKLDELFVISHNIKGQAGSFGYDLVTLVAASLCDLLREGHQDPRKQNPVGDHVRILKQIVEKNVVGDGGETGAKIVKALRSLSVDQ